MIIYLTPPFVRMLIFFPSYPFHKCTFCIFGIHQQSTLFPSQETLPNDRRGHYMRAFSDHFCMVQPRSNYLSMVHELVSLIANRSYDDLLRMTKTVFKWFEILIVEKYSEWEAIYCMRNSKLSEMLTDRQTSRPEKYASNGTKRSFWHSEGRLHISLPKVCLPIYLKRKTKNERNQWKS